MANFNDLFASFAPTSASLAEEKGQPLGTYDDVELKKLWERIRKECIDTRLVFETQWKRNILYVLGRQWIEYSSAYGWRDKRMAQWMPRPVTNKCKETVQAIRAMFTSIRLGVNARPNGADPKNVSAAATADELAPVLHETHVMNQVQTEFDYWLLVTGNAFLHSYVDYDLKHGVIEDPTEACVACGAEYRSSEIGDAGNVCPDCGEREFESALDDKGEPILNQRPVGKPTTLAFSPLELAFPNDYVRFDDLPYVVRLRWRTKTYYENHPQLKDIASTISWQKSPNDQSLSLFKSLSQYNDMGVSPSYLAGGIGGQQNEDGIAEYEVWYKPCDAYPDGLVFRVVGEKGDVVIHLEDTEGLPGPLPYKDADGKPLFTFAHAGYEHVGGRVLASGPLDPVIQKQDQINQLDSSVLLAVNRMSNPVWMIPKGAEPTKVTGMPGLIIEWNAMAFGGTAKPERIEGVGPHPSLFTIREQYLKDFEELTGTFDIMKGAKPPNVEAFSAMQLLVEQSRSRFASVFLSRGEAYKQWFKFALELEREFGPDDLTKATLSPAKKWTFQNFKRAQLQGSVSVVVEDGSNVPKTTLGMRAGLDHAAQLGMVNMQDPDQQYEGLKLMGLTKMVPTLDVHIQAALQKQQAFEDWTQNEAEQQKSMQTAEAEQAQYVQQVSKMPPPVPDPMTGMAPTLSPAPSILNATPLKWHPWYNAMIHRQEFFKWANGDTVRELLTTKPQMESLLAQHLTEIEQAMMQQAQLQMAMTAPAPPMQGAGRAMKNSNNESTKDVEPKGIGEGAQNAGPR